MKYVITRDDGYRLCKDGRLRDFAMFGSPGSTVKIYKSYKWAEKKCNQLNRLCGGVIKYGIIHIPDDATMNASGRVYRRVETSPGFEKVQDVNQVSWPQEGAINHA